jgi:hypothetical protein
MNVKESEVVITVITQPTSCLYPCTISRVIIGVHFYRRFIDCIGGSAEVIGGLFSGDNPTES